MELKKKKIPTYKIKINQEDVTGFDFIALVDEPAIESNWLAFQKDLKFVSNNERRIITGPILVADMEIYRFDQTSGKEYNVVFEKQVIEQLIMKFMRNGFAQNVNAMHDPDKVLDGVNLFEIWQSDKLRGVMPPKQFSYLPDGSAFASYHISNDDVWNNFIKTGEFKGFSIEGKFDLEKFVKVVNIEEQEIIEYINSL